MDYYNELHELCETIKEAISEANEKIKKAGGSLSAGDVEYIDKLTHSLKSIKAVMAMMDEEDGGEYSGSDGGSYRGGSYRGGRGGSYRYSRADGTTDGMMTGGSYRRGGSYARGGNRRGMVTNPTGRNQYSREGGYSRAEGDMAEIVEELRGMMDDLPEEKQREVQRFIDKVDRM